MFETDFNKFRYWFNKNFSLSLNGKYKGLSTLLRVLGDKYFEHFRYKLTKILSRGRGRYHRGKGDDITVMVVKGCTIKLYVR